MKLNLPESPDTFIQSLTDPKDWQAAHWAATVFLYNPFSDYRAVPGIALAFEDFTAGKKIFDHWIGRLGHLDSYEELRISIIEGPVPVDPNGYSVFISSNALNTIKRKQLLDPAFDPKRVVRFSRLHRMNPVPGSPHLSLFKKHFAAVKRYRIFPAHFQNQQIQQLDQSRYIEKSELNLFHVSELKPHQAEYAVFNTPP